MEIVELVQWSLVLILSLYILIRGADVFIVGAKDVGASMGMSSFAIGVLIVGLGTSLPELASSLAAVLAGTTEIVIANAVGSNITNILLIVGVLAMLGGPIIIKKDLLKTEIPIFFIATVHFVASVYDGVIDRTEAFLLFATFCVYMWYLFSSSSQVKEDTLIETKNKKITFKAVAFVVLGITAVLIGANYTVEMAVNIATGLSIPLGLVSIGAIAIGTSLPELFVTLQALKTKETDLAIGNIFGSNAFNILLVVGLPGLIMPLEADAVVMELGIWILVAASLILFVNGLARQVQKWEGVAMILFFCFFVVKLISFV